MAQKNELTTLIPVLLITGVLLGGGYWWFNRNNISSIPDVVTNQPTTPGVTFNPPTEVAAGTTIEINGSTSMVGINQALKKSFEAKFPGTTIQTDAKGSNNGIEALLAGEIDLAAISRELTTEEKAQGLGAIPVAEDSIAIVVSLKNPYRRGLTSAQIQEIFQGKITDWAQVGGKSGTIKVLNRPPVSGTHHAFQHMVLQDGDFGTTPNIITLPRDATTPLLQALSSDGIGYATYAQIANQQTVRIVPVDGLTPEAPNYPYRRTLYYVYKNPASPGAQAFLGYLESNEGKQAIVNTTP